MFRKVFQDWIEAEDSKTGWKGLGWVDTLEVYLHDDYHVVVTDVDKHSNPIEGFFVIGTLSEQEMKDAIAAFIDSSDIHSPELGSIDHVIARKELELIAARNNEVGAKLKHVTDRMDFSNAAVRIKNTLNEMQRIDEAGTYTFKLVKDRYISLLPIEGITINVDDFSKADLTLMHRSAWDIVDLHIGLSGASTEDGKRMLYIGSGFKGSREAYLKTVAECVSKNRESLGLPPLTSQVEMDITINHATIDNADSIVKLLAETPVTVHEPGIAQARLHDSTNECEPDYKTIIDIETGETCDGALIFTMSGVRFVIDDDEIFKTNPNELSFIKDTFHVNVRITDQLMMGRKINYDTMCNFWSKQDPLAIRELHICDGTIVDPEQPVYSLPEALGMLLDWIRPNDHVFARGPDFEVSILTDACKLHDMKWCRRYNRVDDVRTYINTLTGGRKGYIDLPEDAPAFVMHHSLDDCKRDAYNMVIARRDFIKRIAEKYMPKKQGNSR